MTDGKPDSLLMGNNIHRYDRPADGADGSERLSGFLPVHVELAPRHVGKLVQALDADHAAPIQQVLRDDGPRVRREGVDEDVAVEKFDAHRIQRLFASSRSNRQPWGSGFRNCRIRFNARAWFAAVSILTARAPANRTSTSSPSRRPSVSTTSSGRRMTRSAPHFVTCKTMLLSLWPETDPLTELSRRTILWSNAHPGTKMFRPSSRRTVPGRPRLSRSWRSWSVAA